MRIEAHVHIGRKRKGLTNHMSVREIPGGLVTYFETLYAKDVTFSVQPAGLRKFRETKQKNVHAFVRGNLDVLWSDGIPWREVVYNPNVNDTFVDKEYGFPVERGDRVFYDGNRLFYVNFG